MDLITTTRIALFFIVLYVIHPALGAVGRTPGSADVSDSGEGRYSIPIFAPPGIHGMTPQLALVYSHRDASTLLGAGWSISGLSAITRCPKIWAADAEARDVHNDFLDRFCLDGNKLRLTSAAGTYGQAGATYQTEIETFARITSFGTAGNGPASFVVEGKDGLRYEYGNTADSRIESLGQPTARVWALNQIRDRTGNAINFVYFEDTTNGAYRIDAVQYTSNSVVSSAYEIDFVWETKPSNEIDSGYVAGSKVKQITRLDKVDVKFGTTLVRRYELTYQGSLSTTSKSRLASIQECAGAALDCRPATTFTYNDGTTGLDTTEFSMGMNMPTDPWPIDVNGDGRTDLVYSSDPTSGAGTWMVMLANSSGGYNAPVSTGVSNTGFYGATPIDYDADGREDLLIPLASGNWGVLYGTPSGLGSTPTDTGTPAVYSGGNVRAFDVNGDGRDDLVWAQLIGFAGGDSVRYRLRDPAGSFGSTVFYLVNPLPANQKIDSGVFGQGQHSLQRVPDFNGDGRGDLTLRRTVKIGTATKFWLDVYTTGGAIASIQNPGAAGTPTFGDFNGDGKTDLLYMPQSGILSARFGTGSGLTGDVSLGVGGVDWAVLDWDGDGIDDILTQSGGLWYWTRATGESFAAVASTGFASGARPTVADINGDGLPDLAYLVGTDWRYRRHAGNYPDLLNTATDAFGNSVTFTYAPLTSYASYTKGTGATFPMQEYVGPLYVVTNAAFSNGLGGTFNLGSSAYGTARVDLQGRGFLGFASRTWIDSRDGTAQRRSYRQDFPFVGAETMTRHTQEPSGTIITEVLTTYSSWPYGSGLETRSLPFASQIITNEREAQGTANGALIRTTTQDIYVDATTGTPYDVRTTVTEPLTGTNGIQPGASYAMRVYTPTTSLTNDTANWCIGRPQQVQEINSHNQAGGTPITRTTDYTWATDNCRVTQQIIEQGDSLLQVIRDIGYDSFGNVSSDVVTGVGITAARTTLFDWGTDGHFLKTVTNAMGEQRKLTWNDLYGQPATMKDPNDLETIWTYDAFGRRIQEDRPDGTDTVWTYNACTSPTYCGDTLLRYYVETKPRNTADTVLRTDTQYFDAFDRLKYDTRRFVVGGDSTAAVNYDAFGRVIERVAPHFAGGTAYSTTFAYDLLGRVKDVSRPTSDTVSTLQTTHIYYEALQVRTEDPLVKQSTKVFNVLGGVARSIDHAGYYQTFSYDAFGNVVSVVDSLSNTLQSNTFNKRGMRTAITDMDAGTRNFTPNALGEIVSQLDLKGQTTTFTYDDIGRLKARGDTEGTSNFTFGTAATSTPTNKNVGLLIGMSGPGYSESSSFDDKSRLTRRAITVEAVTYNIDLTYNGEGTLDILSYPTTPDYQLQLKYEYGNGQLLRVKELNTTNIFWEATNVDPWGNIINETIGSGTNRIDTARDYDLATGVLNSIFSHLATGAGTTFQDLDYSWNAVGSLTQRHDALRSLTESFGYDNLRRLTTVTGPVANTIGYNSMGNITSNRGLTYTYDAAKKHQVTGVGASTYHYDPNGNVDIRAGSSISWYSYDLPNLISGTAGNSSQFFYAPDRSRWKQVANYAATNETTIFIGGILEKTTRGGVTSWKHYIAGATGTVAEYIRRSNGTNETRYLLKDPLGSIDVMVNASGAPIPVPLSFDAWGVRRDGTDWNGPPSAGDITTITNTTRRGFTFHEMLDNVNLVHMNGRVYDPAIGRFLSADPIIDGAGNTQGWNRYSYVHNNPLSYTDPSGFTTKNQDHPRCKHCDFVGHGIGFLVPGYPRQPTGNFRRRGYLDGSQIHQPDAQIPVDPDSMSTAGGSWSAWDLLGISTASAADSQGLFDRLWSGYPSKDPYVDQKTGRPPPGYEDQCAIKLSVAFHNAGMDMKSFNGGGLILLKGQRTAIRAEEFAGWLKSASISGVGPPEIITGTDWADRIEGRTGIVFFGDYWVRGNGQRSGDHIDLWKGSRMTGWDTWFRVHLGISWDGWMSDFGRSQTIIFWPVQ